MYKRQSRFADQLLFDDTEGIKIELCFRVIDSLLAKTHLLNRKQFLSFSHKFPKFLSVRIHD